MKRNSKPMIQPFPLGAHDEEMVVVGESMEPGVYFIDKPIEPPPGWVFVLHVDNSGAKICCVMIAPEHTGPSFRADSQVWWELHKHAIGGPHPAAFPGRPVLQVVPRTPSDEPG